MTAQTITADSLNAHLAAGGIVQVSTYLRSTIYGPKHAGLFITRGGRLSVRRGKYVDALAQTDGRLLVGIKFGQRATTEGR